MNEAHAMNETRTATKPKTPRWKFWLRVVCAVPVFYVVGYFALMDRHRPTSPLGAYGYFQSSFRWVGNESIQKPSMPAPVPTPHPGVTVFNVIYEPMDRLYFRLFPRPQSEVERLREIGYYR